MTPRYEQPPSSRGNNRDYPDDTRAGYNDPMANRGYNHVDYSRSHYSNLDSPGRGYSRTPSPTGSRGYDEPLSPSMDRYEEESYHSGRSGRSVRSNRSNRSNREKDYDTAPPKSSTGRYTEAPKSPTYVYTLDVEKDVLCGPLNCKKENTIMVNLNTSVMWSPSFCLLEKKIFKAFSSYWFAKGHILFNGTYVFYGPQFLLCAVIIPNK